LWCILQVYDKALAIEPNLLGFLIPPFLKVWAIIVISHNQNPHCKKGRQEEATKVGLDLESLVVDLQSATQFILSRDGRGDE
jgi:hypothetical protein